MTPDEWADTVPFLSRSEEFAAGFRLGVLYLEVVRHPPRKRRHVEYIREADEEQARVMMHRLGWSVVRRQATGTPGMLVVSFRRRPEPEGA